MRQVLGLALILGISAVGCASKNKAPDVKAPPPQTTTGKVEAKAAAVTKEVEKSLNPAVAAMDKVTCTLKTESRDLEIRAKDKGCELAYTKAGQEKVVATSKFGSAYCQTAMKKIQESLTKANYTCK